MSKKPIEVLLDEVDFKPLNSSPSNDGLPYVTHEGYLTIGDITIKVYVLNNGERIIPHSELERLMPGVTKFAEDKGFEKVNFSL